MRAKFPAILVVLGYGVACAAAVTHTSHASARVFVRVAPSIAVSGPTTVIVNLRDPYAGSPIHSEVQFQVRANTPEVEMQVVCTDLCRGGNPSCPYRIPVAGTGAEITYAHGSQQLSWQSASPLSLLPPGWSGAVSEVGTFTTPSTAAFTENVTVGVSWHAADPTLPAGEYVGFVKLIGLVRP
jgi:hypothetical protein